MEGLPKDLIELISFHCASPEDWLAFASTCRATRYGTQRIRAWFSKAPAIPWVWKALIGCACAEGTLPEFELSLTTCLVKTTKRVTGKWAAKCVIWDSGQTIIPLYLDAQRFLGEPFRFPCDAACKSPLGRNYVRIEGKDFRFCSIECMRMLWA